jgi:hypothetical protein
MIRRFAVLLALLALPWAGTAGAQSIGFSSPCAQSISVGASSSDLGYSGPPSWYVDSVGGNNANSGRSPSAALATIAQLLTETILPGQALCLARGSTWREMLTVPANNVTVAAYGSGNRPLLDASDAIAAVAWSKTGGQVNVYQANVAIDVTTNHGGTRFMGVWIDGTRLTQAASLAACDAAAGTYYIGAMVASPVTLYVHSTGDTNPAVDGKVYDYTNRAHGLDSFDVTGVRVAGIHARRNFDSYGSINIGRSGYASDIRASEGNSHNLFVRAYSTVSDSLVDDGYYVVAGPIPVVSFENPAPAGATTAFNNVTVTSSVVSTLAFYAHTGAGTWTSQTYNNCTASLSGANSIVAGSDNTTTLFISGGTFTAGTIVKSSAATNRVSNVTFTPNTAGASALMTDAANETWYVDRVTSSWSAAINPGVFFYAIHTDTTATITNNVTIAPATKGHIILVRKSVNNATFTITGNNWAPNSGGTYYYFSNATGLSYTSDYNNFKTDGAFQVGVTPYANVAAWKAGTGQDANSTGP